jgi:hypothetical protein
MSQDTSGSSTVPAGPGLTDVKRTDTGWEVTLQGYTEPGAVGTYLWPGGVPAGVTITVSTVVLEPSQVGIFELSGITIDALQTMDPAAANWFAQASVLTADQPGPDDGSQSAGSSAGSAGPSTPPSPEDQAHVTELWNEFITDGAHTALEIASWFAQEDGAFLAFFDGFAGPAGDIVMLYNLFSAVIEAFQEELKGMTQQGYIYGLLLQAADLPTPTPEMDTGFTLPMHSFEEMSAAFMEGLANGRQDAQGDIKLNNAIAARIGYYMATQKETQEDAATELLGELLPKIGVTKAQFIEHPLL